MPEKVSLVEPLPGGRREVLGLCFPRSPIEQTGPAGSHALGGLPWCSIMSHAAWPAPLSAQGRTGARLGFRLSRSSGLRGLLSGARKTGWVPRQYSAIFPSPERTSPWPGLWPIMVSQVLAVSLCGVCDSPGPIEPLTSYLSLRISHPVPHLLIFFFFL